MNISFRFYVMVYENGDQVLSSFSHPNEFNSLGLILNTYPSISELEWFKKLVIDARKKQEKSGNIGLNNLSVFVTGDITEITTEFAGSLVQKVPTDIVLEYIEECIKFHERYHSGSIPGLIPPKTLAKWNIRT